MEREGGRLLIEPALARRGCGCAVRVGWSAPLLLGGPVGFVSLLSLPLRFSPIARAASAFSILRGIAKRLGRLASTLLLAAAMVCSASEATAQDSWTTKASSPTARRVPAVAAVNGILYAMGGAAPGSSSSIVTVEAYDPVANTWSTKASMPVASQQLVAGVINGIVYAVTGGTCCGAITTLQAYDPASNTWSTKSSMATGRYASGAGVLNGILYVVGGGSGYGTYYSSVEAYDPATNSWTTKAPMLTARVYSPGVGVVNGKLYVVGGGDSSGLPLATM